MSVLKIKNADGDWVGVTAIKGEKGEAGTSPRINVNTNTDSTYKLRIITEDKEFITPNLKGSGGIGGSGNISSELGTIDNYKDFQGKNIPTYNSDMPPLQCFEGGTTYVFDREVRMLVYNGGIDENGNTDIDKYVEYQGQSILVPTNYSGYLTDYVIYNPVPKKEWDTWENPNIVKFLEYDDPKFYEGNHAHYVMPNLKANPEIPIDFESGDAYITYKRIGTMNGYILKKGQYDVAVYNREDFPFILDEPVQFREYNSATKEFSEPVTIPYPSPEWDARVESCNAFKVGIDCTLNRLDLICCDEDGQVNGNKRLMEGAEHEDTVMDTDHCYDMVIASPYWVEKHLSKYNSKPVAPAMYVGLAPLKNYTIETTAGDCALILSDNDTKIHITKSEKVVYPSEQINLTVSKSEANGVGGTTTDGGAIGGVVTGGGKLQNGTVISYERIDNTKDPIGILDLPCAMSCPKIYLKKGESYTFQVEDEHPMYGIYVCCWDEDAYAGIKIVEGIEPYSKLMEERMASGATKFNIKTYWTPNNSWNVDTNEILQEFNIKLTDNTTENDYCRYLNAETIKHFDLDEFTMLGHQHKVSDMSDMESYVESLKIPKMVVSTSTLADGVSDLEENTFHFVYEE